MSINAKGKDNEHVKQDIDDFLHSMHELSHIKQDFEYESK